MHGYKLRQRTMTTTDDNTTGTARNSEGVPPVDKLTDLMFDGANPREQMVRGLTVLKSFTDIVKVLCVYIARQQIQQGSFCESGSDGHHALEILARLKIQGGQLEDDLRRFGVEWPD
jgi:hypothetical protein